MDSHEIKRRFERECWPVINNPNASAMPAKPLLQRIKPILRLLHYITINGSYFLLAWAAVHHGHPQAAALFQFLVWLLLILAYTASSTAEIRLKLQQEPRAVPERIDTAIDFAFACFLAWHSWTFTAVLTLITAACIGSARDPQFNKKD